VDAPVCASRGLFGENMDFFLGGITGFVCGFGLLYIQYHKSEMSTMILNMGIEIDAIKKKCDTLLETVKKPS